MESLNGLRLPGVKFRWCFFTPTFWRFKDTRCNGIQVHVINRDRYKPVETGVHLLSTLKEQHPEEFKFVEPSYDPRRHFDLLAGTDKLREQLEQNTPVENIVESWEAEKKQYLKKRERHLLYGREA